MINTQKNIGLEYTAKIQLQIKTTMTTGDNPQPVTIVEQSNNLPFLLIDNQNNAFLMRKAKNGTYNKIIFVSKRNYNPEQKPLSFAQMTELYENIVSKLKVAA